MSGKDGEKIGATKVADAVVATVFPIPRHVCVANVSWSLLPYEADLLAMTDRGYLIEVEIKISLADLKRDAEKSKWRSRAFTEMVSRFYYAMPQALWDNPATRAHIRDGAGVIVVSRDKCGIGGRVEVEATRTSARPLTQREQYDLARVGSYRAWSPQQKHRRRQLIAEHKIEERKRDARFQEWMKEYARRQEQAA